MPGRAGSRPTGGCRARAPTGCAPCGPAARSRSARGARSAAGETCRRRSARPCRRAPRWRPRPGAGPRQRVKPLCHSSSVISLPSGRNHDRSLTSEPWIRRPWKNRRRWNTGCSARRRIELARRSRSGAARARDRPVRATRSRCPGSRRCCCRPASGRSRRRRTASACPARAAGWRGSFASAARGARGLRRSSVGPSTPQFHERLSSVPSRLSSPLASLCFSL